MGNSHYKSPAVITMKRKDDHTVEISQEGYKREAVEIKGDLKLGSGWVIFSPVALSGMGLTRPPALKGD